MATNYIITKLQFLDPEGSLSATTVVVLVVVVTRFREMPKALLIRNGKFTKLRIHIRNFIPDRSTVLDFYQVAPPSGSVVPFVLVVLNNGELYSMSTR